MISKRKVPIVLINPPAERVVEEYDAPSYGHLGLAYLASSLNKAGLDCAVLDAKLGRMSYPEVLESVALAGPKIVGISSHTHEINMAARLAGEIKTRSPAVKTVIGGIHASSLPHDTLDAFDSFDFLVKGEGEEAFVRLCKAIIGNKSDDASAIPGVGYRDKGEVVVNAQNVWIEDLDSMPFPAWGIFPAMKIFPVISSRGCPYKCIFCARMLGDEVRTRSPENVIAELEYLVKAFGARNVYFYDETFGFQRAWLVKFLESMKKSGLNRKLRWGITTRAQLLTGEILKGMKEAGCSRIDFGVESGDDGILKAIKKGERKEDFLRAASLIKKSRIASHSYYILGHPNETPETAMNTIDFAARLNTDFISIGIMVPYPGTEVARLAAAGQGGYKKLSADWSDYNKQLANALELESLSRSELTRLQLYGYLKFYVRNFKVVPFICALWRYKRLILALIVKYLKGRAKSR